uniref:Uncharacterized protein n=1 Tax=Timema douglasi TaxID=61478 RepID=A0A7R8VST6_TIMDO|nr:unnamed protein product [Timema douglasi]
MSYFSGRAEEKADRNKTTAQLD